MEKKVEISSEDIKFLENENINLDELLENAIQHKKREWRQNNPIPNIPKSVLKVLKIYIKTIILIVCQHSMRVSLVQNYLLVLEF